MELNNFEWNIMLHRELHQKHVADELCRIEFQIERLLQFITLNSCMICRDRRNFKFKSRQNSNF
jgi:hypothetical protein